MFWRRGATETASKLFDAASSGDAVAIRKLIRKGVNVDCCNQADDAHTTALHIAAGAGHLECVQVLLRAYANRDAQDDSNWTPLHYACQHGHSPVVQALLEAGADKDAQTQMGSTPLHFAAESGHLQIVYVLLKAGANKAIVDADGKLPEDICCMGEGADMLNRDSILMTLRQQPRADFGPVGQQGSTVLRLFDAAKNGDMAKLREVLKKGVDVNCREKETGWTPLQYAARNGHAEMVQALLAAGANKEATNNSNSTAILYAARNGHGEVVKVLLAAGVNQEAVNLESWNPLLYTAVKGHTETMQLLLAAGANKDAEGKYKLTALHYAAENGCSQAVQMLLQAGANKDAQAVDCRTPLHYAAGCGHLPVVELLLAAGANKEALTDDQWSPLHYAARNGHLEVVQALLKAGADKEVPNENKWVALHVAARNGHVRVVRALLDAGANKNAVAEAHYTALHFAAEAGHVPVTRALLDAGARMDARTHEKWTPLHIAARTGHTRAVEALLSAGVNVEAATDHSNTPLHYAARSGHALVVQALMRAGANKEAASDDRWTALHYAATKGHAAVAKLLLDSGANKEAFDADHWTPLHYAAEKGHTEVVQALVAAGANKTPKTDAGKTPADICCTASNAVKEQRDHILFALGAISEAPRNIGDIKQQPPASTQVPPDASSMPAAAAGVAPSKQAGRSRATAAAATHPDACAAPPRTSAALTLFRGGTVTLSTADFKQAVFISNELVMAGFKAVVIIVNSIITANPVSLIGAVVTVAKALEANRKAAMYCKVRVDRTYARVAAVIPALVELQRALSSPSFEVELSIAQSLTGTLMVLAKVVLELRQLLRELEAGDSGVVKRTVKFLQAEGYREAFASLEAELQHCLGQLSTVLGISNFMHQARDKFRSQEELQVARWQAQNVEDMRQDMAQLEGLMLQAVGGVEGLEKRLAGQEGMLEGQRVQLQQVAAWLQGMKASSVEIVARLEGLENKMDGVKAAVDDNRCMLHDLQSSWEHFVHWMKEGRETVRGRGVEGRRGMPPMVIARSSVRLPEGALREGASGAFGTVVQAFRDGGVVAVKVFNYKEVGATKQEDAVKEAWLLHKANHHNVVRCFGVLHDPDTPQRDSLHGSLVMEWVGGGDLHRWLQGGQEVGLEVRMRLALQVAAGMKHLHEVGVVHGDLKPQNVLLQFQPGVAYPEVKICDFGLAKYKSSSMLASYRPSTEACTLDYTSPERTRTYRRSKEDDAYAFCILLHFLATSTDPFDHIEVKDATDLKEAIRDGVRPPIQDWAGAAVAASPPPDGPQAATATVAPRYSRLAQSCWAHDPASRPDFEAIYEELSDITALFG